MFGAALIAFGWQQAVTNVASADPVLGTTPAWFGFSEYSGGVSSLGSTAGMNIAGTLAVDGDLTVPSGDTLNIGAALSGQTVLLVDGSITGTGTLCIAGTDVGRYNGANSVTPGPTPPCGTLEQTSLVAGFFQYIDSEMGVISTNWASIPRPVQKYCRLAPLH